MQSNYTKIDSNFSLVNYKLCGSIFVAAKNICTVMSDKFPSFVNGNIIELTDDCYEISMDEYVKHAHKFKRACFVYYLEGDKEDKVHVHPNKIIIKKDKLSQRIIKELDENEDLSIRIKKNLYEEVNFVVIFKK